jgi:hypothetical protein
MLRPGLSHVVTFPPGTLPPSITGGISLSHIGHLSPPVYSFTTPGGCDSLQATWFKPPRERSEGLNPGRVVYVYRGGSVVWNGVLDEPDPATAGWTISAHGSGTQGADYRALYTVGWGTGVLNDAVDQAIARGLPWVRQTNLGAVSGVWSGQKFDSTTQSITDMLNGAVSKGGLTWMTAVAPGGQNRLTMFPLPTVPNRILIATAPVAQSIASGPNALFLRYQATFDSGSTPATYAIVEVDRNNAITKQGRREDATDLGSAGVLTSGAATTVGTQVMKRFTRAGFTDPFIAQYGQLCNIGGVPVDPGVFYQDGAVHMFCRVLLSDFAFSGEVTQGPVQFLVGAYQWDDAAMTATITPFENFRADFATLLQDAVDGAPGRTKAITTHKKHKHKK